jgi:hypothetical protein
MNVTSCKTMNDEDNMLYIFLSPFIAQHQVVCDAYQSRLSPQNSRIHRIRIFIEI